MTNVEAIYGVTDLVLRAEGHATGNPAVCAGVSALLYTLANWICNTAHSEGWPEAAYSTKIEAGKAFLMMPLTHDSETVFTMIALGLGLLESVDPGVLYTRMVVSEVRGGKKADLGSFGEPAEAAAEGGEPSTRNVIPNAPTARNVIPSAPTARNVIPSEAEGSSPCPAAEEKDPSTAALRASAQDDNKRGSASAQDDTPTPDPAALAAERHARASAFARARCQSWLAEAEALQKREPGFDLNALARDRVFTLLLAGGVPMAAAYRAADAEGAARRAAAAARRDLAQRIRAGAARPTEAGAASQPAFALRPDPNRLDEGQIREVLARIDRRERVSFG